MLFKRRIFPYGILFIVTACFSVVSHLWITDHKRVQSWFSPIVGAFAQKSISCSGGSTSGIKSILEIVIDRFEVASNQVALISSKGELSECHSGWISTPLFSQKISRNTYFRYASNTKLVTAEAILDLVRLGRLDLNDSLSIIFPEVLFSNDPRIGEITIGQLLRHEGGFDRERFGDPMFTMGVSPWCPNDLSRLGMIKLHFEPGTRQIYSNLGYCILGEVVHRVTGKGYKQYVETQFHLNSRGMEFVRGPYSDKEPSYSFVNELFYLSNYHKNFDFDALASSAGLSGSAESLATFIFDSLKSSQSPNLLTVDPSSSCDLSLLAECYGMAFYRVKERSIEKAFFVHEGYLPAATSLVIVSPHRDVVVITSAGGAYGGLRAHDPSIFTILKMIYEIGARA